MLIAFLAKYYYTEYIETEFPLINQNTRALDSVRYPDFELKTRRIARYTIDLIKGGVYFEVYNIE